MNDHLDLSGMRVGYGAQSPVTGDSATGADGVPANLDPSWIDLDVEPDAPWRPLFAKWLAEAVDAKIPEPNAMVLGTVDEHGHPATRTVLCKNADARGVVFFTGYESGKGRALSVNAAAAVTFPWIALERQVHFRGRVVKVDPAETEAYWRSRPRGSQISGRASDQSRPVASREALEAQALLVAAEYGGVDGDAEIPVPPHWGGYRLVPEHVEFWQGRADRLHNRVLLTRDGDRWTVARLQP